jgi:dTDP-4-dehydrorhamnose reductase
MVVGTAQERAPGAVKVFVTGAGGQVGREVMEAFRDDAVGFDHATLDVTDPGTVRAAVQAVRPDAIIHCAAYTAVDACESHPDLAFAVNAGATRHVMEAAREVGAYVVYLSTDYVFDGTKPDPYVETDTPNPLSVYGKSKLAGEHEIHPDSAIVRISWVCGRYGNNMVKTILRLAEQNDTLRFVSDQRGNPTIVTDLVEQLRLFVAGRLAGIWHVTNQGAVSWYEFAQAVLEAAGDDPNRVEPIATSDLHPPRPAPRPANSVLENRRLREANIPLLPDFRDSLPRLLAALAQ